MIKWSTVFEDSNPEEGASSEVLSEFVATVRAPLSDEEVQELIAFQQKLFPQTSPLHAQFQAWTPRNWVIPSRDLPPSYLDFLKWSNGGTFRNGDCEFGFFPANDPICGVRAMMLAYQVPEYMPEALAFAFDGAGTFYLFDMRKNAEHNEYPVVMSHAGSLGWSEDDFVYFAESFSAACRCRDKP